MSWRHRISVLLIVLTAYRCRERCARCCAIPKLPPAPRRTMALGNPATTSRRLLLRRVRRCGAAGHDCSDHDAANRVAATTTATRADSVPGPSLLLAVPVHDSISLADSDAVFDYRTPPGNAPPTHPRSFFASDPRQLSALSAASRSGNGRRPSATAVVYALCAFEGIT